MYIAYSFFFFWYEKDPLQVSSRYSLSRAKCHAYIVDLIKFNTSVDEKRNRRVNNRGVNKYTSRNTIVRDDLADTSSGEQVLNVYKIKL